MWKKMTVIILVLLAVFSSSTIGYTASMNYKKNSVSKVEAPKYQVTTPKEDSSPAEKKVALVSGKAPEGTSIVIELYGTTISTTKDFTLAKLPKEEDYILISSENIKAGDLGFGKEIDLVMGINKIVVIFDVEGEPSVEKILYYYEIEQVGEDAKNPSLFKPSTK